MESVLVDFDSAIEHLDLEILQEYEDRLNEVPGIFALMEPVKDAIESFKTLTYRFDTYILSTLTCENHAAVGDRLQWIKKYLGKPISERLIITHYKNLNIGDYLIDAGTDRGVDRFIGEHIHFGSDRFPNWQSILKYLLDS